MLISESKKNNLMTCPKLHVHLTPLHIKQVLIMHVFHTLYKLENCVSKTQVMPPYLKPVLTPCPILTHDPQHIQSILETNVWNVKVKIAVILSRIMFLCAKKIHAHLQYAFIFSIFIFSCAKFRNECLKTLRGVDYTILLPLNEA